ncbi:MAG: DUF5916 domain-containing protein [Gemmatimonadota bacterium]
MTEAGRPWGPVLFALLAACMASPVLAQAAPDEAAAPRRIATAVRVESGAIEVDGVLDEAAWSAALPLSDLVQKEPTEGAAPSERTEVRFAYDGEALYVGARMEAEGGTASIQAPMGRRDQVALAEYILVSLDTYLDRRTAHSFGVSAAGVRIDHFHRSDNEGDVDRGFDPIWEARVTVDEDGWSAEMWIPFSQLRFDDRDDQVWGLNVHRWIPSKNEDNYWILVPRTEQGWASRFGDLQGIADIPSSYRVELLPYLAGGSTIHGDRDPDDPFDDGRNLEARMGLDLKMGLGPNLTLDATVRPDFGQVEVDPAVVNLSVNETFNQERRPFFTEGSQLLSGSINNYFYSRRIGAPPAGGRASGDYVDYPGETPILGAAKVTGRLPSGTSIGVLAAVTGEEHARIYDAGEELFEGVRVQPLATWGVARVQQEFGTAGSTASLFVAGVQREFGEDDPLAAYEPRRALTVATESLWRLAGGTYELGVSGGVSHVNGDPDAILRVQRAAPRYYQRPDATHVNLDPERTSLSGYKATVSLDKVAGTHWLWAIFLDAESPGVEFNDVGRLSGADGLQARQSLTYRETQPGELFRNYRIQFTHLTEWNYAGDARWIQLSSSGNVTFDNFWSASASLNLDLPAQEWQLTRGGPSMETPREWRASLRLQNSGSAETRWSISTGFGGDEFGGWSASADGQLSLLPGDRWQVTVSPSFSRQVTSRQYFTALDGGPEITYGERYIFAFIDRTTLSMQTRVNFTLKPDVNLDIYAQPFASSGRYRDFGELLAPRSRYLRTYGEAEGTTIERTESGSWAVTDGADSFVLSNRDFNLRSFRSTAVLRWEWRPGSTLYLVWQQDRSRRLTSDVRAGVGDVFGSLGESGDNFFAVKVSYWLGL